MNITYHLTHTPLGLVLIALAKGEIWFAQFGDSESQLLALLRDSFNREELLPAHEDLSFDIASLDILIKGLINGEIASITDPIVAHPRGTAFQIKVWSHLRSIPRGEVRSYQDVARDIGNPFATRAVASACSKNMIALIIPCHRVIRSDRTLGGYKWGLNRKRALLESERRPLGSADPRPG